MIATVTPACSAPQSTEPYSPLRTLVSMMGSVNFFSCDMMISAARNSFQALMKA